MAKPIQRQTASLIPPVCIASPPLWWWCLYGFLALGKLSHGRVILPPSIGTRPAWFSSYLRCRARTAHISWVAAVTSFADWHLDACNCLWQLTGDLLSYIWHLGSTWHIWWCPVCYAVPWLGYGYIRSSTMSLTTLILHQIVLKYKPIGALPGHNYVLTRMVIQII